MEGAVFPIHSIQDSLQAVNVGALHFFRHSHVENRIHRQKNENEHLYSLDHDKDPPFNKALLKRDHIGFGLNWEARFSTDAKNGRNRTWLVPIPDSFGIEHHRFKVPQLNGGDSTDLVASRVATCPQGD
ncbi:MAG: hypothetical protein C5B49_04265 [Bdellovibrio sp.]|nr:MAG: hypothetical protein C5B49_04265 [Bdellovibrio sp.]